MITEPGEKHTFSPNKWEKINGKNKNSRMSKKMETWCQI